MNNHADAGKLERAARTKADAKCEVWLRQLPAAARLLDNAAKVAALRNQATPEGNKRWQRSLQSGVLRWILSQPGKRESEAGGDGECCRWKGGSASMGQWVAPRRKGRRSALIDGTERGVGGDKNRDTIWTGIH